ncbi:MAG: hypothetical protein WC346_17565 [Methanogenium sp.]|jgi:hypothetical protein
MGKLYFLVGLARSGKSVFAQKWINQEIDIIDNSLFITKSKNFMTHQTYIPRTIVCADDIRLSLGHRWNGHVEPFVNAIKLTMIKSLLYKHDVLVDGTHTTPKSILELLNIDKNALPFVMNTSPQICKQRAKETNQEDLYPVIDRMYNQMLEMSQCEYIKINNIVKVIDELRSKVQSTTIRD